MFLFKQKQAATLQISAGTTNAVVATVRLATNDIPLTAGRFAEIDITYYISRDAPSEAASYIKFLVLVVGAATPTIGSWTAPFSQQDANGGAPSGTSFSINGSGDLDIKVSAGTGGGLGPVFAQVEIETTVFGSA